MKILNSLSSAKNQNRENSIAKQDHGVKYKGMGGLSVVHEASENLTPRNQNLNQLPSSQRLMQKISENQSSSFDEKSKKFTGEKFSQHQTNASPIKSLHLDDSADKINESELDDQVIEKDDVQRTIWPGTNAKVKNESINPKGSDD